MGDALKSNNQVLTTPPAALPQSAPAKADAADNHTKQFGQLGTFTQGMAAVSIGDLLALIEEVLEMEQKNRSAQAEFTGDQAKAARDASTATKTGGSAALNYAIGAGVTAFLSAAASATMMGIGASRVASVNTTEEDSNIDESNSMLKGLKDSDLLEGEIGNSESSEPTEKLTAKDMEDTLDELEAMIKDGGSKEDMSEHFDKVKRMNAQFEQAKAQDPATDGDDAEISNTRADADLGRAFGDDDNDTRTPEEREKAVNKKLGKVKEALKDKIKETKEAKGEKVKAATAHQENLHRVSSTFVQPLGQAIQGTLTSAGTSVKAKFDADSSTASSTQQIQKGVADNFESDVQKMDKLVAELNSIIGNISRAQATISSKAT